MEFNGYQWKSMNFNEKINGNQLKNNGQSLKNNGNSMNNNQNSLKIIAKSYTHTKIMRTCENVFVFQWFLEAQSWATQWTPLMIYSTCLLE